MSRIETRCLVIGSGIAGMTAAIHLAEAGVDTTLITAAPELRETNTVYAQGGIIFRSSNDTPEKLIQDIIEAGAGVNYRPAVEQLSRLGPDLVKKFLIETIEVPFDRKRESDSDEYQLTREGGHSDSRILHFGDQSGLVIEEKLVEYANALSHLQVMTGQTAVNLLMTSYHASDRSQLHGEARCFGAFIYDQKTGSVKPIFAEHVVLATGGVGQIFLHNTNSRFSRGDGIALAHRAGCRLENLEYIQFHPTTFYHSSAPRFLVSEAVRGEGAVIMNELGERFLKKYLPQYDIPELAPRDRVAKAIHQEMLSSGAHNVYLDISFKPADWIRDRFPFVYGSCLKYGLDITKEPIPVVPGAHYHCGGVWSDLNGRTSVPNLWAIGEVACTGVHGANRLASTSLLEGLVWGTKAAESISKLVTKEKTRFPTIAPWQYETSEVDSAFLSQDWLTLKHTMWNYVGLIKTELRLSRAEGILSELSRGIENFYRKAKLSDSLIGLRHAALTALLILDASRRNPKSLGCYVREDLEI